MQIQFCQNQIDILGNTCYLKHMNSQLLQQLGFSESLATAYLKLLEHGTLTPPQLAQLTHETRPNAYSLLSKLVELKLASKRASAKKATYQAENPVALQELVQQQRQELQERERLVQDTLPDLMNTYQMSREKPGVRFYSGKKGIQTIFEEQLKTGQPIRSIKTLADVQFFGFPYMHNMRMLAPKAGVPRIMFTPDDEGVGVDWKASDARNLITRTWYKREDYTAPVEWSVFGNKVSIISFGKEAIGMVIDSPQIAESVRQLFTMLDEGLQRRPGYNQLPKYPALTKEQRETLLKTQ